MATPRCMPESVRLSDTERDLVRAAARQSGLSISGFLRRAAVREAVEVLDRLDLRAESEEKEATT